MPKVEFIVNPREDAKRAINHIAIAHLFKDEGYDFKLDIFPKEIIKKFETKPLDYNPNKQEINEAKEILKNKDYTQLQKKFERIEAQWRLIENDFFSISSKLLNTTWPKQIKCIGVTTGPGGTYDPKTKNVFLDMNITIDSLAHELIHTAIEEYIEKHNITQAQKERIVDLYMFYTKLKDLFPNQEPEQDWADKTVDQFFNKDTNIEYITSELEKVNKK